MKKALLLLVVVLAVLACAAEARHRRKLRSSSNRKGNFDFFFLVRQWPATFCNDHYCTHRPPKKYAFTVHGMWPQRRDGTWPEYCEPSDHLRMDGIDDLLDDLEQDWPSWSSTDEVFWDHEWTRHGTCAAPVTGGQHGFFKSVLALHEKYNIQDALIRADIRPSNAHRYSVREIKDAIEAQYGVMPHVTCDNHGQLAEVWMCVNKKLRLIDCVEDPRPHNTNKGRRTASPAAIQGPDGAAAAAEQGEEDEVLSAPVPPNYNCDMVTIPKLRKGWHKHSGRKAAKHEADDDTHRHQQQHDDDDEDEGEGEAGFPTHVAAVSASLADAAAAVSQLGAAAVTSVVSALDSAVDAAGEPDAPQPVVASVTATLAAVEQTAAAVVTAVAEAVAVSAEVATVTLAEQGDSTLAQQDPAPEQQQQQEVPIQQAPGGSAATALPAQLHTAPLTPVAALQQQQRGVPGPNQHLPLLAAVVVAVVAAAVVAAAVALRAQSCSSSDVGGSCKVSAGYEPPACSTLGEPAASEACPLLAVPSAV